MIVNRGYCSFCGRHANDCRGGVYAASGDRVAGPERVCRQCLLVAYHEFGEPPHGPAEVVPLRRSPPVEPWPPDGPKAA